MTESASSGPALALFYVGWERYNRLLVEAVAPLTPDQLALSVAPNQRTIATLVAHIVAARARWFHGVLGEGDHEQEHFYVWDGEDAPTLKAAQLELGLEHTWRLIAERLTRWTPADLDASFTRRNGEPVSRQWVIWHVIEHDLHHGGELSLTLGAHGLRAPDL